ncbi:hypothetical protein PsAD2_00401 [Pseudovibrio axinellae]|uniref:Bacteriophage tail tape measure C-terminal domain-containing protein n=1 Tax=Pseudovibrio axinellae TaxID=989403 RepID=A0A166AHG0_9HYPH|nr:hypothetical protein [Pseudovibrio axinellae]KZL21117.1 hypothetical protein PsAD2_00401 [Pseudovibrio axinellae]SEQ88237.1 hypothetical protein SAMN05421798_1055 [Pseudovibrio axinellae]
MTVPDLVYNVRANDKSRAAFEGNRRSLQKTRRETQLLNTDMSLLGRSMGGLKAVGITSVTAAVVALGVATRKTISDASSLAKVADKVGVTTDELQRLRYGFELTGVAAGTTDTALQRFSRRIGEAANGSGVLNDVLKANGIELRDVTGKMKSQGQILAEYADLIKNAGSEQERLLLSFKAFDREGAGLVLALKNGSEGLGELMRAADEAGGVIEEELLRKAEQIDDEFAKVWRTFEVGAKRATLQAVSGFRQLFDEYEKLEASLAEFGNADIWKDANRFLDRYGLIDRSMLTDLDLGRANSQGKGDRILDFSNRIGQGFTAFEGAKDKPTIIPQKSEKTSSSVARIDQYARVLEQLQREQDLLGMNAQEQRRMNALRLAGVEASSQQGQELIKITDEIHAQALAQQQVNDLAGLFGDVATDSISELVGALGLADTAAGNLIATLAEAALQAAFLGQGPLASTFGSSPEANVTTALISGFKGFFAQGGTLGAGEWGLAGENGVEPVVGPAKIISNQDAFGGGSAPLNVQFNIQTQDVESFRQSQGQVAAMMFDAIGRGQRNR